MKGRIYVRINADIVPANNSNYSLFKNFEFMNLIDRVKNILTAPAKEWDVIAGETPDINKIVTGYVLPLAGAAAIAAFIGYGIVGANYLGYHFASTKMGIYQGISVLAGAFISVFLSSFVIDSLAPNFGSEKNMPRSVQLVAYSYTAAWVGGLFTILPAIAFVGILAGLYGLYILYLGFPKIKKTPVDKHAGYFVVSLLVIIAVSVVIGIIISRIVMPSMLPPGYGGYGVPTFEPR